ncbi:hypothetical protein [Photobacterium minamisatsumaniensis]|uniref:hypothetical protein n=1 Tax=Photobacterium minamisatsumaniensis TaxID=2910233 RepID=UPI003D13EE27
MKSRIRTNVSIIVMSLSIAAFNASAQEVLPSIPLSQFSQWESVGEVEIAGERYTKLYSVDSERRGMPQQLSMDASASLFVGDTLLATSSANGPMEVSGGLFLRLAPSVNPSQFAHSSQLEIVHSGSEIVLVRTKQDQNLLPLISLLEADTRVEQVRLELVGGTNRPQ